MGCGTWAAGRLEVYNVQGLAHAKGMLMAYLPKEKILIEADLFTPPAPNAPLPTTITASQDVLQQRTTAEPRCHDHRADPRRSHVPMGGFCEVRHACQVELEIGHAHEQRA